MNYFLIFIIFFIFSYLILYYSIGFLKRFFSDVPNKRSSHKFTKPKSGGYIFVFNSIISSFLFFDFSLLLSLPLGFIGLIDDKFNLPVKIRLIFQILTISLILKIINVPLYMGLLPNFFLIPLLILLGASIINFSNFMDGIDGLVAGCYLIIFLMGSILIDNIFILIASSLLAFLFFNWDPSKLFMGDLGSTFLGSIFFTLLLKCDKFEDFFAFLLISSPLMIDALICVIRRILKGKTFYKPHRDHLYQRLCDNNISHGFISFLYILSTSLISLSYLFFGINFCIFLTLLIIFLGIILDNKFALKFN